MADVLLTHSYHLARDEKQLRKMQPYAPLGTLYAATALRRAGISVSVFDTTWLDPAECLSEVLRKQRPSIVAVYEDDFNFISKMCLISMRETAKRIAAIARETGAVLIVHGSDATDNALEYLSNGFDYVLNGEAEEALTELCQRYLAHKSVDGIQGLETLDKIVKKVVSVSTRARNASWVSAGRVARELIDVEPYRMAWTNNHGYFSANIVASRGCPYQCNWCAKPISANKFQLRSASEVVAEVCELRDLYGVEHIWFADDIFALNKHWMQEFANGIAKQRIRVPYKIQTRADLMSPDVVEALQLSGCAEVWMGAESGSQRVLDAMDKNLNTADICRATVRLRAAGIKACYFLQFGYPGEEWPDIQKTIALVREMRPDDIGVSLSYPLPGTVFYERVRAELGARRNWNDTDDLCVTFSSAYATEFYRTLRDALHLEVALRDTGGPQAEECRLTWQRVEAMEVTSRTRNPTIPSSAPLSQFVRVETLLSAGGPA